MAARPERKAPAPADRSRAPAARVPVPAHEPAGAGSEERAERGQGLYPLLWRTGVLNVLAIARRELGSYFVSPVGWVVVALLIPLVSGFGYLPPLLSQVATTEDIFGNTAIFMVFFIPLSTMRLLAEERRAGTLEILLTSPVRDWEVVTGKWLGSLVFYLASIAFTLVYVALLSHYVPSKADFHPLGLSFGNLDYGQVLSGYVGLILLGSSFLAIGVLASSLTRNQLIAAFVAIVLLLAVYLLLGVFSGRFPPPYSSFLDYMNGQNHFSPFLQGQVNLKDAVYFLSLTVGALFLATRSLESRRWR